MSNFAVLHALFLDIAPRTTSSTQLKFDRHLPVRGLSNYAIVGITAAMMTFGFYRVYHTNVERQYDRI